MKTLLETGLIVMFAASTGEAQSLSLSIEAGSTLADGVLSPGEAASFTVRAVGTAPPGEVYQAFQSLFGFGFGTLGPGQFEHTGHNPFLVGLPSAPGLLYDDAVGRIGMMDSGGFWQIPVAGIPMDVSNPIYLFSFSWTPSSYDGRVIDWTSVAEAGAVYVGGNAGDPGTWNYVQLSSIGTAAGSFRLAPSPGAAGVLCAGVIFATTRRRSGLRLHPINSIDDCGR